MVGHIERIIDNGSILTIYIRTSDGKVFPAHGDKRATCEALDNIAKDLDLDTFRGLKIEYALTSYGALAWIAAVPTRAINGRLSARG